MMFIFLSIIIFFIMFIFFSITNAYYSLSFSFSLANRHLEDRAIRLDTTYISFAEYSKVSGIVDIDRYIRCCGFTDREYSMETVCKYLSHAVTDNISISLSNTIADYSIMTPDYILARFDKTELRAIIEIIVKRYSGKYTDTVWQPIYKNFEDIVTDLMYLIRADGRIHTEIDSNTLSNLIYNMIYAHVISELNVMKYRKTSEYGSYEHDSLLTELYVIQPAIKYCFLRDTFSSTEATEEEILDNMMQQFVAFDVRKSLARSLFLYERKYEVYRTVFEDYFGNTVGKYDMLVYDKEHGKYMIFAITHLSGVIQDKNPEDPQMDEVLSRRFGTCGANCNLYNGESVKTDTGAVWLNTSDFLIAVDKYKDMDKAMETLTADFR